MSLKACLFKISRLKGVGIIGRWAYILCSGFVSLVFRLTPEIRSAYLAGSMSGGDIAPGLSDIDFVIVIKDLSAPDEYRFVNSLEKTLRYLLPPFGKDKLGTHVLIYSVGEWTLVGDLFCDKRYGQPRKLFQKDEITRKHNYGRALKGLHQFYKALWRLEAIQQNLPVPVDNGLERALGERILERSLLSIENGFSEVRGAGETPPSYISLRNEIKELMSKADGSEGARKVILVRLLHLFDLAAGICFPGPAREEESEDILTKAPDNIESEKPGSKEFRAEISGAVKHEAGTSPIFLSRMKYFDIFLYDPGNYGISEKLIGYYCGQRERSVKIMSKERFEKFCLTLPTESIRFIELMDGKPLTLTGMFNDDGFIIETYSIFPQLRSPYNFKDRARYESMRSKALKLVRARGIISDHVPADETFQVEGVNKKAQDWDEKSEYGRFNDLRGLSETLKNNLSDFLFSGH
jgi:predicted nucleotidyltransferase